MRATGGAGGAAAVAGSGGKAARWLHERWWHGRWGRGCTFLTEACQTCLTDNCKDLVTACGGDATCGEALSLLTVCVCNPSNDATECKATFHTDGGAKAEKLIECYDAQ